MEDTSRTWRYIRPTQRAKNMETPATIHHKHHLTNILNHTGKRELQRILSEVHTKTFKDIWEVVQEERPKRIF